VCLKKEREIQDLKKDAKKLLTTAGLVRDCPLSARNERQAPMGAFATPKRFLHVEELSSLIAIEANLRWKRATRMRIR
jgi:hypothetical protein